MLITRCSPISVANSDALANKLSQLSTEDRKISNRIVMVILLVFTGIREPGQLLVINLHKTESDDPFKCGMTNRWTKAGNGV